MKKLIVGSTFVGSLALVALVSLLGTPPTALGAEDARAIFDAQKCSQCHAVESLGVEAKTKSAALKGGDLSKVELEPDFIAKYLRKQEKYNGKDHKKEIKLGDEEMAALIEWLRSEKS